MNRNQIIVITACVAACIGIYLFANTTKPAALAQTEQHSEGDGHDHSADEGAHAATTEKLDMEIYLADINSRIEDKATINKIEELEKKGDYAGLLDEYRKLRKPLALVHYAMKLAKQNPSVQNYLQAGDYSAQLLESAPDEKSRNYLQDNILYAYSEAAQLDSTDNDIKLRLAAAYIEISPQPMQGVAILLDVVRKDSTNIDAQLLLGRFGIVSGQYDKAIVRLEKVLYLQPQNSEAMLLLAEAYNNQGNNKKALDLLERCKKTVTNPQLRKEIEGHIEQIKKQVN